MKKPPFPKTIVYIQVHIISKNPCSGNKKKDIAQLVGLCKQGTKDRDRGNNKGRRKGEEPVVALARCWFFS